MNHSSDYQPGPDAVKTSFACSNEDNNETSDDSLEFLRRDGEDESETEWTTSESISQSDDGVWQSEDNRNPGLNLDPQFDNLKSHLRAEENSDEFSDGEMESDPEYESDELDPNGIEGQSLTSEVPHAAKLLIRVDFDNPGTMIDFAFIFTLGVIIGVQVGLTMFTTHSIWPGST